jgi:hypothetical protein
MLLPGVGFDVVPSDCLAAHLARRLPDATRLALAFRAGSASRGTLETAVEGLGRPGAVRRGGRIVPVPPAWRTRRIDFGDGRPRDATTIPWGDVSTAWHSTGIPDVEVYAAMPAAARRLLAASRWLAPVLRSGPVRRALARRVRAGPAGPDEAARGRGVGLLWGEAVAADGRRVEARLRTPEPYTLTARTAVHLARGRSRRGARGFPDAVARVRRRRGAGDRGRGPGRRGVRRRVAAGPLRAPAHPRGRVQVDAVPSRWSTRTRRGDVEPGRTLARARPGKPSRVARQPPFTTAGAARGARRPRGARPQAACRRAQRVEHVRVVVPGLFTARDTS